MKRLSTLCTLAFGLALVTLMGCGSGNNNSPSADEVSNFVADHPELLEKEKTRAEEDARILAEERANPGMRVPE